jgi:hypothetical protein
MALTKGSNSYVTVAEADAYFADRLDTAAWDDTTPEQKGMALVTATMVLDELEWTGVAISVDQSLAFPRNGSYFDPKFGVCILLDEELPKRIEIATYELAYHLLNNDGLLDDTGLVESLQVGPVNLTKVQAAQRIPAVVKRQINPLLRNRGANSWWRAN